MTSTSYNSRFSSGVNPSGIWRAYVHAVNGDRLAVTIPRLGQANIYNNVPYSGLTPGVGDKVWVVFLEGKSNQPVALVGANDTTGDPSDADITEVIAGLGLSGGGDSGSVTLDFEPSELSTVGLSYDDKIVISDDSDGGEPKLVTMADVVVTANADGGEPIGHAVRTDSVISFDYSSLTFTIAPVADSYVVWCKGRKFVKTSSESVTIPNTSGLYYISFDQDGVLQYKTTYFVWDSETPTAYIYFNSSVPSNYMLFDERHGVVLDWQTHEYLHRTRGAAFANGFGVDFSGGDTGDNAADAQINLDDGTFFDEDLQVDITHSNNPTANTWQQDLRDTAARLPVFYISDSDWVYDSPTDYPVKQGTARPKYNLYSGGSWSTVDLGANQYGVYWVVATNNLNYPVLSVMGQGEYSNVGAAEAVTWDSMSLTNLPVVEMRVLYKIILRATGSNVPGCYFDQIVDFRYTAAATSAGTVVGDHGALTGLGDDDHQQYPKLTSSDGAPVFPRANDLWYNSSSSKLYVFYVDGSSSQWVEIGGSVVSQGSNGAGASDFANIFMLMGV